MNIEVIKGIWWLPDRDSRKLVGELQYSNHLPISLEVIGSFETAVKDPVPIILGFSTRGQEITLFNCNCTRRAANHPGIEEQAFVCAFVFFKAHFSSIDELVFSNFSVQFSTGQKWLDYRQGFSTKHDDDTDKIVVEANQPAKFGQEVNGVRVTLAIVHSVETLFTAGQMTVRQHAWFTIEFESRIEFDALFNEYLHLRNLIVLCTQIPIIPKEILLSKKNKESGKEVNVNLFYPEQTQRSTYTQENEMLPPGLIEGELFRQKFNQIINNWFENKEKLMPLIEPYFDSVYLSIFQYERLLMLTRLLESMQRTFKGNQKMNQVKRYIDLMSSFREQIGYAYSDTEVKNWASELRDYRNKFTHNDGIANSRLKTLNDIDGLIYDCNLLVNAFVLEILGFNKLESKELVRRIAYKNRPR